MNKLAFAKAVAKELKIEQTEANHLANDFFTELENAFVNGEGVDFKGFGKFELKALAPYETNSIHKTRIKITNSVNVVFKQSPELKKTINE